MFSQFQSRAEIPTNDKCCQIQNTHMKMAATNTLGLKIGHL